MANQTKRADRSNLTLESVQKSFEDWRNGRGGKRKIPQKLWQQVIQILPHYKQCKILSTLNLNHKQVQKQLQNTVDQVAVKPPSSKGKTPMLALPATPAPFVKAFLPMPEQTTYQAEWQQPDGAKLIISHLDASGLNILIQNWRNSSCSR